MDDGGGRDGERQVGGDERDATEVFELLADETRLAIVRELARERQSNWRWQGKTFAELRRAVGVEDAGNFSYHLEKLRGSLVAKDGDTYKLHNRGFQLVGAVESGQYTAGGEPLREPTGFECPVPDCDRSVEAVYDNQHFRLRCPDHYRFSGTTLPPVVVAEHDVDELVAIATMDARQDLQRARRGVCPLCWGPVDATLPAPDPTLPSMTEADVPDSAVFATFDCRHCGLSFDLPPGACVVDHPAVVTFYEDHGEDIRGRPFFTLPFCRLTHPDVESRDPVRVRVDVELDGDRLSLWLDGETDVVEYERA